MGYEVNFREGTKEGLCLSATPFIRSGSSMAHACRPSMGSQVCGESICSRNNYKPCNKGEIEESVVHNGHLIRRAAGASAWPPASCQGLIHLSDPLR